MTKRISSKSIACAQAIGNRETFNTHGALRAENVKPLDAMFMDPGRLAGHDLDVFLTARAFGITYAVFSYGTPIAWVTTDGTVHKVEQKFSVTTSQHQGKLYML